MLTFAETKDSSARIDQVAGCCPDSDEFRSLVNAATRRALRRGDFNNTVVPVFVCVFQGCVVWPRYVEQVRAVNLCNQALDIHNDWYRFLPENQAECGWMNWRGPETGFTLEGETCVVQDIQGDGRLVRAYPRCRQDVGKKIQIFGTDNNGNPLQEKDVNGNWVQGNTLALALPFASTPNYVRKIDYVVKDETQCIVDLFAYNASQNVLEELAHYDGSETTPTYRRTRLNVAWPVVKTGTVTPNCCGQRRGVVAMVKLRFIPAKSDTDLVLIDNLDALKKFVQSIKHEEAEDMEKSKVWENDAIHELNRDIENVSPDRQFSAGVNILGKRVRSNSCF